MPAKQKTKEKEMMASMMAHNQGLPHSPVSIPLVMEHPVLVLKVSWVKVKIVYILDSMILLK